MNIMTDEELWTEPNIIECHVPISALKKPWAAPMVEEDRRTICEFWTKAGFQFDAKSGQGLNDQRIESPRYDKKKRIFKFKQYLKP